jgi:hypothetical protein
MSPHKSSFANGLRNPIRNFPLPLPQSFHFNTIRPVHKITDFSVGLYKRNLVTICVIKQINVSQYRKGSITSVCASGYFPFNKVSSRTNVDEEWQMADALSDEGKALGTNTQLTALFINHFSPAFCFISCNWTRLERVTMALQYRLPHILQKQGKKERKKDWREEISKDIRIIN